MLLTLAMANCVLDRAPDIKQILLQLQTSWYDLFQIVRYKTRSVSHLPHFLKTRSPGGVRETRKSQKEGQEDQGKVKELGPYNKALKGLIRPLKALQGL